MTILTIKFRGESEWRKEIEMPLYIPNIGEAIHNEKDISQYYTVTGKEIYYTGSDRIHVIVKAESDPKAKLPPTP